MASNFGSGFRKSRSVSGGHNFNVDSHFGLIKIIFSIDEKTKKIRENVAWKMMRTKPATAVRLNTVEKKSVKSFIDYDLFIACKKI